MIRVSLPGLLAALLLTLTTGFAVAESAPPAASAASVEAEKGPGIARGLLMQHGSKLILAPCRERSYVDVSDMSAGGQMLAALRAFGLADGKPLYVELIGKADQGNLAATSLNFAGRQARCLATGGADENWRASGQNKSWSLVAGAGQLRLSRPDKDDFSAAAKGEALPEGGAVLSPTEQGNWSVRILPAICQMPADGVMTGWQAEVTLAGQRLSGCAWQR